MTSEGVARPADAGRAGRLPAAERWRRAGLGTKIVVFCATLTAVTIAVSFVALSVAVRGQTRALLAGMVAAQQRMILAFQSRAQVELLRTSTLMTDSPTLRAAMETYRVEADAVGARLDLLSTIQREAEKVAAHLGNDLLLITDDRGRVLAAAGAAAGSGPAIDADLSSRPLIRRALNPQSPADAHGFAVIEFGGQHFRLGAAPIVLGGFVIGALALGNRLDGGFVLGLQSDFDCEVILAADGRILAATDGAPLPEGASLPPSAAGGREPGRVHSPGGEEFVTAPLLLGEDGAGRPVTLHLLHSIDRALAPSNRALLWTVLACSLTAMALSGLIGALVSRSLVRPLARLVAFVRDVARRNDYSRLCESPEGGHEVRTLVDTYNQLIESLRRHEAELLGRAREELDRLERLKESEKLAALGRMLSGAAHEINNPLTGVVGNIEILLARPWSPDEVRRRLETVRKEGSRIVALVRSLLKASHRDTGERSALDLNEVIRESLALRRHDLVAAGIAVEPKLDGAPLIIDGNPLELQQVFLNLIGNACDALRERAGDRRLAIRTGRAGSVACAEVEDNGPGLKDADRVFDHFYTTKPVGKGTGLGLSISRAIILDHGGAIFAGNRPEGGARFSIRFAEPGAARAGAPAPRAAPAIEAMPGRSLPASVLVVDDEPAVLDLQMAILDSVGAVATAAASAGDARRLLQRRGFDLIVSDLELPGEMTGRDLYEWVRANRPDAARRFLFVTGDVLPAEVFPFTAQVRVIAKPFSMDEYVTALRECLHALPSAA
jgi:signal transduction histidine kinase/CheY-like chemotaxis protein